MRVRLTVPMLEAMAEALNSRLAGETDVEIEHGHYERASQWVSEQLAKRRQKRDGDRRK